MQIVLQGLLLQALIVLAVAVILWLPTANPPRIPTEWAMRPIGKAYRRVRKWAVKVWTVPGGHVRVGLWLIAAVIVAAVFRLPGLDAYQPEAVSVAFTLIVINELIRYQNRLEYKRSIIRQMASRSNEFALDAARIVVDEGWHADGSLEGADLGGANLEGAKLGYANLEGSKLWGANLKGAFLVEANLKGAFLVGDNLEAANLESANLEGANLGGGNLKGAGLWHANLKGANLMSANLEGAFLESANLEGANLWHANLKGANLMWANLEGAFLERISYDRFTVYGRTTK